MDLGEGRVNAGCVADIYSVSFYIDLFDRMENVFGFLETCFVDVEQGKLRTAVENECLRCRSSEAW